MTKQQHVHTPTRICPHRWCRTVHNTMGLLAVIAMIVVLTHGSGGASLGAVSMYWLITMIIAVAAYAVSRVVLGHSTGQLMRLDRMDKVRGIVLVVRPVWAAIALATDLLDTAIVVAGGALAFAGQVGPHEMTGLDQASMLTGLIVVLVIQGFRDFAHRMATKPVKPKRVTVPALGSVGA